jgi:seryl-tRNA synthetase
LERKAEVEKTIAELKARVVELKAQLDKKLHTVGNLVDETVPVFEDEENNRVERTWGECKPLGAGRPHHELLWMIDGYEPERGVAIAGARQYFLKGIGVRLQMALVNYGMNFLANHGYTALQVPLMMRQDIMAETAELAQFDEELYKVTGDGEDKYLIATSEQPISAYHRGEWMSPKQLPINYAGYSTCFRKEAGSSGRETWGIFRVHQFEKVEQFVITKPELSQQAHEEMCAHSEQFLQSVSCFWAVVWGQWLMCGTL